ncbi:hypothetical protein SAMN06265375_101731 [Muriicola jejuensis]|nr:hypothetical protein SAMN06265375_101731 [Muriicola jejuensis]
MAGFFYFSALLNDNLHLTFFLHNRTFFAVNSDV